MAQGVAVADRVIAGGVHDDPDSPPAPSAEAPRGWTWNRKGSHWQPKVRGKILWSGVGSENDPPADDGAQAAAGPQQRDPDPGWMSDDDSAAREPRGKVDPRDVPQAVKDDIAGLAGLVATPLLAMVQQADPYCGGALAQSFAGVLDATLPIICRSQKVIDYFTKDTADWLLWGKLAMALAPVGRAVIEHHVTRTVHLVRDEHGQVQVVRGRQPESEHGDHLTPRVQYPADAYAA